MPARTLGLILSLWLFSSAFLFVRTGAAMTNAWVVGLLGAVSSVAGMQRAHARFVTTVLSAWLLVSAFALPHRSPVTFWHDLAVAALLLVLSLVPGTMYLTTRHAEA